MTAFAPYRRFLHFACAALLAVSAAAVHAADAGWVKVARGSVHIERGKQRLAAIPGTPVRQSDVVVTGSDGAVGIVFADDSMLSAGPDSTLAIARFRFDPSTQDGAFDTDLRRGSLTAISGKIVKRKPGAMRVRTPAAIMAVRGTQFGVRVEDDAR